jgi:UDPglucose--hexose-1-phosphate uridylyltransferase
MELRKDYILDRWVIIASKRGQRPYEFKPKNDEAPITKDNCIFCPGKEANTPGEIGRLSDKKGNWRIRWFPNKFNAVERQGEPAIKNADTFFTYSDAYGRHEIIVETNEHQKQLADLDEEEIKDLLMVYSNRIELLEKEPNTAYVSVFKNSGKEAGTSLVHSHSQIISLNVLPTEVQQKINAIKKFKSCPYCDILKIESKGARAAYENETVIAFTPYASRFNYEVWLFPKKHHKKLKDFSEKEIFDMAKAIKKIILRLKEIKADYNMLLFYSPQGEELHFHIQILPRIAEWAGFELGSGVVVNTVSPEEAAGFYGRL